MKRDEIERRLKVMNLVTAVLMGLITWEQYFEHWGKHYEDL